jgi:hypothetical protein
MQQKQPNIDNPGRWTHSAKAFAESASILELVEACERYGRDFSTEEAGVRYNAAAEELRRRDPKAYATWEEAEAYSPRQFFRERTAELSVEVQVQRYESLLRQTAEVRYPSEERTPQLQERIEATVRRKVGEFTQERKLKAYEAALQKELARLHPNLTPEQKREYEDRIAELVEAHREGLARQRQQTPPAQVRSQEQGIER